MSSPLFIECSRPSSDAEEDHITVYAGDLTTISDPMFDIKEEHRRIPITILSKGQYLELYAFATLGAVQATKSGHRLQELDLAIEMLLN